jgi:hypothetical protein
MTACSAVLSDSIRHPGRHADLGKEIAMSRSTWAVAGRRAQQHVSVRTMSNRFRIAHVSACSFVVLSVGFFNTQPKPARAGDEPPARAASPSSRFFIDTRASLSSIQEKLYDLGTQTLAGVDMSGPSESDMPIQVLRVEAAKAGHQRAELALEAARIALREYEDGVVPREKKIRELEIELAKAELENADRAVPQARQRYARFKQVKTGSTANLARGWELEVGEAVARLQRKQVLFALELAQSTQKDFGSLQHRIKAKNLAADVERAASDELATRATWELEKSKVKKLEQMQSPKVRRLLIQDEQKQVLALLERALPLEEELSAKVDQIKDDDPRRESGIKRIADLTYQLQEIVDRAQHAAIAGAMGKLGRRLRLASPEFQAAASPAASSIGKGPAETGSNGPIAEHRRRLDKLQEEILNLGNLVLGAVNTSNRPGLDTIKQNITVQSAHANLENARLTREVAEIAVVEYEEGIFKQDQAIALGELKLAENDLARCRESVEFATSRLAKIKQASRGTAEDLSLEFTFEDKIVDANLREPKARLAVEKAKAKLEILREYVRPRRVEELKGELEKARADEITKQAVCELEKSRLKTLQEAVDHKAPEIHEQQVLSILDRAISTAEQLRTRMEQAEKSHESAEPLRKEIAEMLGQLQTLVAQGQMENAAAKWAKLKPRVSAATVRYLGTR